MKNIITNNQLLINYYMEHWTHQQLSKKLLFAVANNVHYNSNTSAISKYTVEETASLLVDLLEAAPRKQLLIQAAQWEQKQIQIIREAEDVSTAQWNGTEFEITGNEIVQIVNICHQMERFTHSDTFGLLVKLTAKQIAYCIGPYINSREIPPGKIIYEFWNVLDEMYKDDPCKHLEGLTGAKINELIHRYVVI